MIARADALGAELVPCLRRYAASMDGMRMREALQGAMAVSRLGNGFMQDTKPWVLIKEDAAAAGTAIASLLGVVRLLAVVLRPFMPGFSDRLRSQGNLTLEEATMLPDALVDAAARPYTLVEAGRAIGAPEPIFSKIADEQVAALRERYAGAQAPSGGEAPAADVKKDRKKPQAGQGSEGGGKKPKEKKPKEKKKPREAAE